ncbi:MAG: ChaN family lipoprotein [Myxococcales bacterium]|nr:ChaN family lipoprotein [Myxococcales bacterium]
MSNSAACRRIGIVSIALIAVCLAPWARGPAAAATPNHGGPWIATHDADHPWLGRIADLGSEGWVDPSTLIERLRRASFVLLGEQHDHPDHHRLEAWVIGELARGGRRPAVFLEMLPLDRRPALDRFWRGGSREVADFYDAVGWEKLGWGSRALWEPLFETLLAANLRPRAADLARVAGAGHPPAGHPRPEGHALPEPQRVALAETIREAHCGVLDAAGVDRMVRFQRARDAQLARVLAEHNAPQRILVAGAGHVRRDRGVPYQLREHPEKEARGVVSVGFLPVDPAFSGSPVFREINANFALDFVWWTPRHDLRDPCERFQKALEGLRRKNTPRDEGTP